MNPLGLFADWYNDWLMTDPREPSAMVLSTGDRNGIISSRMVLMKELNEKGFVFYTNYKSRKGRQLVSNSHAALLFWWESLGCQVRIEGTVEKVSREVSEQYFRSRPRESQISTWASDQSRVIPDRNYLDERFRYFYGKYSGMEIDLPPYWGGYLLVPDRFEFWTRGNYRLHDRILFTLERNRWKMKRLAP